MTVAIGRGDYTNPRARNALDAYGHATLAVRLLPGPQGGLVGDDDDGGQPGVDGDRRGERGCDIAIQTRIDERVRGDAHLAGCRRVGSRDKRG